MSEQQPEGTTVNADTANVTVEAPAADSGSESQDGGDGGQESGGDTPSGLVAQDTAVENGTSNK